MKLYLFAVGVQETADSAQDIRSPPMSLSATPSVVRLESIKWYELLPVPRVLVAGYSYALQWLLIGMAKRFACFSMTL